MVTCVGSQIWWTWRVEDAFDQVAKGNKHAVKEEAAKQTQQVKCLAHVPPAGSDWSKQSAVETPRA